MKRRTPILGFAGLVLTAISAHAQQFLFSNGDLILDFMRQSGSSDLEINLGSSTQFSVPGGGHDRATECL